MKNFFEKWHPKVALRYLPIVDEIKKSRIANPLVLEVGSGSLGIAPYLKMPVTGVDVVFKGPKFPLLKQVLGQATHLPFKDKSFDFVVAVDVLEHLPQKDRVSSISEALRCARKKVFIGCPCGELAFRQDKALDFKYKQIFKLSFPYLTDHLTHGLPQKDWVSDTIIKEAAKLGREVQIKSESNINLNLRQFLMSGWITKNILVDFIFRKVFLLFIPFFRHFNQEPSYRQIFFVDIK